MRKDIPFPKGSEAKSFLRNGPIMTAKSVFVATSEVYNQVEIGVTTNRGDATGYIGIPMDAHTLHVLAHQLKLLSIELHDKERRESGYPTSDRWREIAVENSDENDLDFDDEVVLSVCDNGAYVSTWRWVSEFDLIPSLSEHIGNEAAVTAVQKDESLTRYGVSVDYVCTHGDDTPTEHSFTAYVAVSDEADIETEVRKVCEAHFITYADDDLSIRQAVALPTHNDCSAEPQPMLKLDLTA